MPFTRPLMDALRGAQILEGSASSLPWRDWRKCTVRERTHWGAERTWHSGRRRNRFVASKAARAPPTASDAVARCLSLPENRSKGKRLAMIIETIPGRNGLTPGEKLLHCSEFWDDLAAHP